MAFRRRTTNRRPRRKARRPRRKTRARPNRTMSRPLGDKLKINTRYVELAVVLSPGVAGVAGTHIFSANGLFDPNITGTGHQPIGFDETMAMFDHYTVIGTKIRVEFLNMDPTNQMICGITLVDSSSANPDIRVQIENGQTRYKQLGPHGEANDKMTIRHTASPSRFLGRPNIMSEDDLRGSASANPVEQLFFHVWAAPNSSVDATTVECLVQLDYIAILTEPKRLALS